MHCHLNLYSSVLELASNLMRVFTNGHTERLLPQPKYNSAARFKLIFSRTILSYSIGITKYYVELKSCAVFNIIIFEYAVSEH